MKVDSIIAATLVALWSAPVNAVLNVGQLPSVVDAGKTYILNWTASVNYTYNIWLVQDNPLEPSEFDWTKVQTLANGSYFNTLNVSFPWTVPRNLSANKDYAIWFGCFPVSSNGTNFYTNIISYFQISNSSLATASASASSTASRTAAPTSTSGVAATSGAAKDNASSSHSNSLSGGAIAGIVIGILALIAIIAAAALLRRHRKKKSEREQREAAARANRLDPVMKVGQSSFEMQGRGLNKEIDV